MLAPVRETVSLANNNNCSVLSKHVTNLMSVKETASANAIANGRSSKSLCATTTEHSRQGNATEQKLNVSTTRYVGPAFSISWTCLRLRLTFVIYSFSIRFGR